MTVYTRDIQSRRIALAPKVLDAMLRGDDEIKLTAQFGADSQFEWAMRVAAIAAENVRDRRRRQAFAVPA